MADTGTTHALSPSAITHRNVFKPSEAKALKVLLAARGVRLLPYPFASALAIVSDVDSSRRHRYDGYVGQLVRELGLDFGDSTWLTWNTTTTGTKKTTLRLGLGLGFLTPWLTVGRDVDDEWYTNTRTLNESLVEFHSGNVDHFHAFFARGIRIASLADFTVDGPDRLTSIIGSTQQRGPWSCEGVYVLSVCVVGTPNGNLAQPRLILKTKDGVSIEYGPVPYVSPPDRAYYLFSIGGSAEEDRAAPSIDQIHAVTIELAAPQQHALIERVLLLSADTNLVIERLRWLRDKYNVEMNLITEHSRFHFSDAGKNALGDQELREHIQFYDGPIEAYNGGLADPSGRFVFSTHCDEPHSFGRVFPELSQDLEYRFVNPKATMSAKNWDLLELITPSGTCGGGGIYYARRTRPNASPQLDPTRIDPTPTRQETLAVRIDNVLNEMDLSPGKFCPIYTHLGSYNVLYEDKGAKDVVGLPIPVPYLDTEVMSRLQDRIFNITGSVENMSRVWFSRATTHYDYALMLRSIAGHLTRPTPDTIEIASWMDSCLGKTMPRSAGQLYGLTFYVDDPATAEVRLDGAHVEHLFRNPPDETGRTSVTVAVCDRRYTVFSLLDPAYNATLSNECITGSGWKESPTRGTQNTGPKWTWRTANAQERSFGQLWLPTEPAGVRSDRVIGSIRIPMAGWTPTGAQALSLLCRARGRASFGLLLETRTGGQFHFGEEIPSTFRGKSITASYRPIAPVTRGRAWKRFTIPFHDLDWAIGSRPGGPMPNHALDYVTLFAVGDPGEAVDFADIAFLRPRAITRTEARDGKFCLGGHAVNFQPGQIVHARGVDDEARSHHQTVVDQRGFFCFDGMSRGVYDVWSRSGEVTIHDRRGPRVEVSEDNITLVLSMRPPAGQ